MIRQPAVAGAFYPENKSELEKTIAFFINMIDEKELLSEKLEEAKAFVAPHAGYIYSGYVAAYTYLALSKVLAKRRVDTIVVIGPNHMGLGDFVNISLADWQTPLGIAKNDTELSQEIVSQNEMFSTNEEEIADEHSVEVQIPFIQYVSKGVSQNPKFCFICMTDQSKEASEIVGKAILKASEKLKREIVVVAS